MARGVDIEVVFDRFIGDGDEIDRLQSILADLAPEWWADVHVQVGPGQREPIELDASDGLRRATLSAAFARGPVYEAMVAKHGAGDERRFGMAEIRGASPALTIVINADERSLAWMRDGSLSLGNSIAIQIRRQRVEGIPIRGWADEALRAFARELAPVWGRGSSVDEYDAKVMGQHPNGSWGALGRDFARFLPGLFWLNLFGERYVELLGKDKLLSVPAEASEVDGSVIVKLGDDPSAWEDNGYRDVEAAVQEHLGSDFFFDKSDPDRPTRAPDWAHSVSD